MSVCIDIVVLFISKNNHLLQKNIDSVVQAAVPSGYNTQTVSIGFSQASRELHLACDICFIQIQLDVQYSFFLQI
jgi:hypothetical protein